MADTETEGRPRCQACGLDMWLTRIRDGAGSASNSYVFECKVCGAQVTLSADQRAAPGLEERL